ncbi:MAG TPA: NAD(P)-dependent oxidoreductase [Phycisphaeraceae bacterium]
MSFAFITAPRPAAPPKRRKVFVTGAAGKIGSHFAQQSHDRYELTLMVHPQNRTQAIEPFGRIVTADLADLDHLKTLLAGQDTVVHLAADPRVDAPWDSVLANNIIGTYHLYEAARHAGCRRVIFASTIHAVEAYPPSLQIQPDHPVNPDSLYGVSKCFGEALGRYMSTQHGLSVIAIRIGHFRPPHKMPTDPAKRNTAVDYVSSRDLIQLIQRCIDDETLRFAIVHGLSHNRFNRLSIQETCDLLGYAPQDDLTTTA